LGRRTADYTRDAAASGDFKKGGRPLVGGRMTAPPPTQTVVSFVLTPESDRLRTGKGRGGRGGRKCGQPPGDPAEDGADGLARRFDAGPPSDLATGGSCPSDYPHPGRNRGGQGRGRVPGPRAVTARPESLHSHQLREPPRASPGERALRSRTGCLHQCGLG